MSKPYNKYYFRVVIKFLTNKLNPNLRVYLELVKFHFMPKTYIIITKTFINKSKEKRKKQSITIMRGESPRRGSQC